jgi:hypothetical protein
MIKTTHVLLLSGAAAAALHCRPTAARAGSLEACGDIHIEAGAECELIPPSASCEVNCTPISVQAACAAELTASCSGECNASATVECTGSCEADCTGECEANPGSFECRGSCEATCQGDCSASCEAANDQAECEASCQATCTGSCDAECEGTPPSATCDAKCEASCEGSCDAEANLDCQIDCQADGYVECTAEVTGGCEAACETEDGALFCDGQYVDYGNNLENCIDALNAYLKVKVEASGSAGCDGGTCQAEGKASATCNSVPMDTRADGAFFALGALGVVGAVGASRRRRRNR